MTRKKRDASEEDVVLVGAPLPSGVGHHVLRKRGEQIELGAVRPMEEGKPIHGEVVRLEPREEPNLYDVHVEHAGPKVRREDGARAERSGPAQVATDDYRKGWNRLFSRANKKHGAN